jgi:hypothetical protein
MSAGFDAARRRDIFLDAVKRIVDRLFELTHDPNQDVAIAARRVIAAVCEWVVKVHRNAQRRSPL